MDYGRANKLSVFRKLTNGDNVSVGALAQNRQSVYFQYDTSYLEQYHNLSHFNLNFDSTL
jgi:serine/threonine-protein kinase HipA